jgi:hypothetical protein
MPRATDLDRARWLRQLPERRGESRLLLEAILQARPDDAASWREWGAWWLGEPGDPTRRRRAAEALARASAADLSAAVLLALLESDTHLLKGPQPAAPGRSEGRARLARAIVSPRLPWRSGPDPRP